MNVRRATCDVRRATCDVRRAACYVRRATGFAALLVVVACSNINSQSNSFATLDEARRAGAVGSGLVPAWLPPGSHDLREAHVPGTSERWGIVNFADSESDILRAALDPTEIPLDGLRVAAPARIEWWPIELRGALNGERLGIVGIRGYRSRQDNLIVAVNWKQGRAYYWSAR